MNQASLGYVGEKKYLISAQWWRKWCDFANFGENTVANDSHCSSQANLHNLSNHSSETLQKSNYLTISKSTNVNPFSVYENNGIISNE